MNITDWAEKDGRHYKRVSMHEGGEYHGPCPECGGNDRFHLWPQQGENGTWWCRGCGKGGDLIEYLIQFEGMSFPQACRQIGRDLPAHQEGRTPQVRRSSSESWQPAAPPAPSELWRQHAGKFVVWCHEQLLGLGEAPGSPLHYLACRGINRESAERFRLGWNPGEKGKDLYRAREAWGLETIIKEGGKKKKLWLPIGLIIPFFDEDDLRRIRIRVPEERRTPDFSTPYYVVPGSSSETFVIGSKARAFFIIEAELDGILVAQEAGDLTGVMAMGNSSAHPTAASYGLLQQSLHIACALDYDPSVDEEGRYDNPGGKGWLWWRDHFSQAERCPVPTGKDPGDAFKAGCDIREWVKTGLPPIFTLPAPAPRKEKPMEFDADRAGQVLKDTMSRINSGYDAAGMEWLETNRSDIVSFLKSKEREIDGYFDRQDLPGLTRALEVLEAAYNKAWKLYAERPPVLVRCKMEGGDCVCCGDCREYGEE